MDVTFKTRTCQTCARNTRIWGDGCKAFKVRPKECWAWTEDRAWEEKVKAAVEIYKGYCGCGVDVARPTGT